MARPYRRLQYRGKKQEYIKKDSISNILAKMARWNITIRDLQLAIERLGNEKD